MTSRRHFLLGTAAGLVAATADRCEDFDWDSVERSARRESGRCADARAFGALGDGEADDSDAVQEAIDRVSAEGGGVVYLPAGEYRLAIAVKDGVHLAGTSGTVVRASGTAPVLRLTGDGTSLRNVEVIGSRPDDPSRGLTSHCIDVRGNDIHLEDVTSGGGRYDSIYIRAGRNISLRNCRFGPTARNTCSIVKGVNVHFDGCEFVQDRSVSSSDYRGLYLYDIEPNAPEEAYGISNRNCTFRNGLSDGYGGVILDAHGNRDTGENDVSFLHCHFQRGERVDTVIRVRGASRYRGLTLVGNRFDGGVLTNNDPITLSGSTLVGNRHAGSRFAYNVTLDDVVMARHEGAGWTGLRSTDAATVVEVPGVR